MHKRWMAATLVLAASSFQAHAAALLFGADLSGAIEVPVNASPGTGSTLVSYDLTAMTMRVHADFAGLLGTTLAAHIHVIAPGFVPPREERTGGVVTQVPSFTSFPLGVTSGTYTRTFDLSEASTYNPPFLTANGNDTATAAAVLLTALQEGRAYLNIHTTFAGGGEIRGFLAPVPEPGSVALISSGVALLLLLRRRA